MRVVPLSANEELTSDVPWELGKGPGWSVQGAEKVDSFALPSTRLQLLSPATLIPVALAILFLLLAFHNVRWAALHAAIAHHRTDRLIEAGAVLSVALSLRAIRWHILLSTGTHIPVVATFWATAVGYLGNSFLPARAGEVIRAVLLARKTGTGSGFVLATALIERLADVCALIGIGLIVPLALHTHAGWLDQATGKIILLGVLCAGGLLFLPYVVRRCPAWLARLPVPARLRQRLVPLAADFLLGLVSLRNRQRAAGFALLTIVIWLVDATFGILMAKALYLSLSVPQALLLLVALGLSGALPSTPGAVGIYQFVAVHLLPPFGLTHDQALAYIIVYQGITYLTITFWGLLGLWYLRTDRPTGPPPLPGTDRHGSAG